MYIAINCRLNIFINIFLDKNIHQSSRSITYTSLASFDFLNFVFVGIWRVSNFPKVSFFQTYLVFLLRYFVASSSIIRKVISMIKAAKLTFNTPKSGLAPKIIFFVRPSQEMTHHVFQGLILFTASIVLVLFKYLLLLWCLVLFHHRKVVMKMQYREFWIGLEPWTLIFSF